VEQENCTIFVIEARCCASENEKNLLSLIDGQVSKPKEWEGALQKKNCSQLPGCQKVPGKRSFFSAAADRALIFFLNYAARVITTVAVIGLC